MMAVTVPLLALAVQLPAVAPPPPADPAQPAAAEPALDKVRERLFRSAFTIPPLEEGDTTFRVSVEGWQRRLKDPWTDNTTLPAYIRPTMSVEHHEFLMKVTPEEFRSATVHPTGIPVITLAEQLVHLIQKKAAERAQAAAKREVQKAFTDFLKKKAAGG